MLTFLFIVFKLTGIIHISWWWILIAMAFDEEGSRRYIESRKAEKAEETYSNLNEKYKGSYHEDDVMEILEEYDYNIDEETLEEELENRL